MSKKRYDVVRKENSCYPELHYCRDWDGTKGCYGTNLDHGYTWKEARKEVVKFHKRKVKEWKNKKERSFTP